MNGVIVALIIALAFILTFFWAPIVGVFAGGSLDLAQPTEKEDRKKNYLHRERAYLSFERSVSFPEEVDPSKTEGRMNNEVLELKVPKKEPKPETKTRKIELK